MRLGTVSDVPVVNVPADTLSDVPVGAALSPIHETCTDRTVICITHKSEVVQTFVTRTIALPSPD